MKLGRLIFKHTCWGYWEGKGLRVPRLLNRKEEANSDMLWEEPVPGVGGDLLGVGGASAHFLIW